MKMWVAFALVLFSSGVFTAKRIEAGIRTGDISYMLPSMVDGSIKKLFTFGTASQSSADSVEITGFYVKVYSNPDKSSSVVVLAEQGQRFHIQRRQGEWFEIRVMNTPGWVSTKDAKLYDPVAEQRALEAKRQAEEQKRLAEQNQQDSLEKADTASESEQLPASPPTGQQTEVKRQSTTPNRQRASRQQTQNRQTVQRQSYSPASDRAEQRHKSAHVQTDRTNSSGKTPARSERKTTASRTGSPVRTQSPETSIRSSTDDEIEQSTTESEQSEELSAPIDPSRVGSLEKSSHGEGEPVVDNQSAPSEKQNDFVSKVTEISKVVSDKVSDIGSSIASFIPQLIPSDNGRQAKESSDSSQSPAVEPGQEKYVQIVQPIRVLQELSPESPILGMAGRGAHYRLVNAGDSWCKIVYKDKEGWVERRYLNIVDAPSSIILKDFIWVVVAVAALILIFFIVRLIMSRFDKVRNEWFESVAVEKKILLVARTEKTIQRYLTNTPTTLHKTFSELGFTLKITQSVADVHRTLTHFLPDIVAVDWAMQPNVFQAVEHVLTSRASTANLLTLFYNVPNPQNAPRSRKLPNTHYFGSLFNDRDIFSLVTPLINRSSSQQHSIQKSVEEAALTGDVADGSLAEVFQFAEIGRKTGCLLLEDKKPFGLVFFNNGLITYAASRKNVARDAVFDILNLEEGRFRFVLNKKPQNSNCKLPTLGILMEWTKEIDEAHGR